MKKLHIIEVLMISMAALVFAGGCSQEEIKQVTDVVAEFVEEEDGKTAVSENLSDHTADVLVGEVEENESTEQVVSNEDSGLLNVGSGEVLNDNVTDSIELNAEPIASELPSVEPSAESVAIESSSAAPTASVTPSAEPTAKSSAAPTASVTPSTEPTAKSSAAPTASVTPSTEPTAKSSAAPATSASPSVKPSATPSASVKTYCQIYGHSYTEATCTEPATCKTCGAVKGEALGHNYTEATCTEPATCKTCGATKGTTVDHSMQQVNQYTNGGTIYHVYKCDNCSYSYTKTEINYNTEEAKNEIIELVNEERAKQGLTALQPNPDMQATADLRAKELYTQFSHTRPDGTSCWTAYNGTSVFYCGENIAFTYGLDAEEAMDMWMESSGHRANILGNFQYINVGVYTKGSKVYYVQCFSVDN